MSTKLKNDILIISVFVATIFYSIAGWQLGGVLGVFVALRLSLWLFGAGDKVAILPNHLLPLPGFGCINLFGYLLCRDSICDKTLRHEQIHTVQMREMLYIGFYLWYIIEWVYQGIVRLFNKDMRPYHFITFEQEAYEHDDDPSYLQTRKRWAWVVYIGKWIKY